MGPREPNFQSLCWIEIARATAPRDDERISRRDCHACAHAHELELEQERKLERELAAAHADDAGRAALPAHAHPDHAWVRRHFTWPQQVQADAAGTACVEPPQLWGTHAPIEPERWAAKLGLGALCAVRLSPELVSLAGAELACIPRL